MCWTYRNQDTATAKGRSGLESAELPIVTVWIWRETALSGTVSPLPTRPANMTVTVADVRLIVFTSANGQLMTAICVRLADCTGTRRLPACFINYNWSNVDP